MGSEAFILDIADYNVETHRWSVGILAIPNAKLERLNIGSEIVDPDHYKVVGRFIEFTVDRQPEPNQTAVVYVNVNASKTRFQLNTAIVIALIGLFGTLFPIVYPDIPCFFGMCKTPIPQLASMSSTRFGLIKNNSKFVYTFGSLTVEDKGSFFPKSKLTTDRFWFALKLRDGLDINKYHFTFGAKGPYVYRAGVELRFEVPELLKSQAQVEEKNIQLVTILANEEIDLSAAFTLENIGDKARIVHIPSEPIMAR